MNTLTNLTELWDACRAGNTQAYATLHNNIYPGLFRYANKVLKDTDATNDLLQEVFIKMWNKRNELRHIGNIQAYFYQTTRFSVINLLRCRRSQMNNIEAADIGDLEFSAEEVMIRNENDQAAKRSLLKALNRLPARQREMIYFRYYEGLEYRQIVSITGIRYQSVVNHIHRAVQCLRQELLITAG